MKSNINIIFGFSAKLKFSELNYNPDFTNKCIKVHGSFFCWQTDKWRQTVKSYKLIICKNEKKRPNYNLHMQNTRGMKAPMATKMGSMAEPSSFSYGSWALGPLGFRFFTDESLIWSDKVSSSVSLGNGGNWGQSETKREKY